MMACTQQRSFTAASSSDGEDCLLRYRSSGEASLIRCTACMWSGKRAAIGLRLGP
jgi:hypothetical protein